MFAWYFIAAAAVLAAVAAYLKRPTTPPGRPGGVEIPLRDLRVLMLGREQSGKTILMASMWRELHIAGKAGVSLAAEHREDEIELGKLCRQIEDPTEPLPAGSPLGKARDWKFTVRVQGKGAEFVDAFRIHYIDYSGEYIPDLTRVLELDRLPQQLRDAVDSADIIMGILDGLGWPV